MIFQITIQTSPTKKTRYYFNALDTREAVKAMNEHHIKGDIKKVRTLTNQWLGPKKKER